jgi:hypothetical protein
MRLHLPAHLDVQVLQPGQAASPLLQHCRQLCAVTTCGKTETNLHAALITFDAQVLDGVSTVEVKSQVRLDIAANQVAQGGLGFGGHRCLLLWSRGARL